MYFSGDFALFEVFQNYFYFFLSTQTGHSSNISCNCSTGPPCKEVNHFKQNMYTWSGHCNFLFAIFANHFLDNRLCGSNNVAPSALVLSIQCSQHPSIIHSFCDSQSFGAVVNICKMMFALMLCIIL